MSVTALTLLRFCVLGVTIAAGLQALAVALLYARKGFARPPQPASRAIAFTLVGVFILLCGDGADVLKRLVDAVPLSYVFVPRLIGLMALILGLHGALGPTNKNLYE